MIKLGSALHLAFPLTQQVLARCKPSLVYVSGILVYSLFRTIHVQLSCIASLSSYGCSIADYQHLQHAINQFNDHVSPSDAISAGVSTNPVSQQTLSKKSSHLFNYLLGGASSMADKVLLVSVLAPRATSLLSVVP